jgi:hypothetical protein
LLWLLWLTWESGKFSKIQAEGLITVWTTTPEGDRRHGSEDEPYLPTLKTS